MASQTNDHASPFSMSRMFAREHVVQNAVAKTGNLDSSQLTHLKSAPKTLDRTNYSPSTPMDVKRAVHRVRSSGSVAPKKKNAVVVVAFTINYDRNGALSGGPTDTYRYSRGSRVTVLGPGNLVYPPDATFLAWNTNPSGTGIFILPGNTFVISQNTILYAISQPLWPVLYDSNSPTATGAQQDPNLYAAGSQAVLLDQGTMLNPGLTFMGWNALLSPGTIITVPYGGITMNAFWATVIPILWQINYELNSDTATGEQNGPQYLAGATATVLGQGTMENPGFSFLGWSTDELATVPDYPVGFTFVMPVGNVTLYAIWEPAGLLFTINYDKNSVSASGSQNDEQYSAGATATVLGQGSMLNTGLIFLGWSNNPNATVPNYPVGLTFVMPSGNVTLYAIWEQIIPILAWFLNASHNVGLYFSGLENRTIPSAGRTFDTVAETGGVDVIVQTNSFGQFLSAVFNRNDDFIFYPVIDGIYASEMWTWRQYATVSNSSGVVTLSFKFYVFHGGDNTQTFIGQSEQSAALTTTPGSYVDFSYTFPDLTLAVNDRFMVELYQNGTGTTATLSTFFEGTLYSAISVFPAEPALLLGPFYTDGLFVLSLTPPPGPGGGHVFNPNVAPAVEWTSVSSALGNPVLLAGVVTQTLFLILQSDPPNQVSFYFNLYIKNTIDQLTLVGTSQPSTETGTAFTASNFTSSLVINANIPLQLDDRLSVEYVFVGTGELIITNVSDGSNFLTFA